MSDGIEKPSLAGEPVQPVSGGAPLSEPKSAAQTLGREAGGGSGVTSSADTRRMVSFVREVSVFTQQIESLASSLPLVMRQVADTRKRAGAEFVAFLESAAEVVEQTSDQKSFRITGGQVPRFRRLRSNAASAMHAFRLIPRSFLVSLVSQYDSYIGRLIRLVLLARPEILKASERALSFSDLVRFDSLEEARDSLIEREVESVIRKSHADHFAWFERRLGIPLRKDLDAWPAFIELTERRNLFVHCDGVVSSQYLDVCREHCVNLDSGCQLGKRLNVSSRYFGGAFECIYEVGVKLAHVVWRKLMPMELGAADENLNDLCIELLSSCKYGLAIKLLDFGALTLKKHADENYRRIFVINRAQAYKWSGLNEKCLEILDAEDWSASSDKFKLGAAVLRGDFATASGFVKALSNAPDFEESHYKNWPLFKEFRESAEFLMAYEQAYGEPFNIEEIAPGEDPEAVGQTQTPPDGDHE